MSLTKTVYEVTETIHCPLCVEGDTMALTMTSCSCGAGKEVCLVLARDFMSLLMEDVQQKDERTDVSVE